jgi:GGDEF domain-containing protein
MEDFNKNFVHYYPELEDFGYRARQELKRAERYACFLSLVDLNLDSLLSTLKQREKFRNGDYEAALTKVREFVCHNLRETDIVSGIEGNRMMILLAETPFEGAHAFSRRLSRKINEFVSSAFDFSYKFDIGMEISSFPHDDNSSLKLAETIEKIINN